MADTVWMSPGSTILEISTKYVGYWFFQTLAADMGFYHLDYKQQADIVDPDHNGGVPDVNSPFECDLEAVLESLWVAVYVSDRRFGAPVGSRGMGDAVREYGAFKGMKKRYAEFR
jgi:hypothetical protein